MTPETKLSVRLTIAYTFLFAFFIATLITTNPKTRTINGTVCHEVGDYTSIQILTEDGEIWTVENCVAPLGAACEVTFNTQGTSKLEDDVITSISCKIK